MSWFVVNKVKLLVGDQGYHWEAKLIKHIAFLYCFSEAYLHSPSAFSSLIVNLLMQITSA